MGSVERVPLNVGMDGPRRILWRIGWNPTPTYVLFVGIAILGWVLVRHPIGLALGLVGLVPRWKAIGLINRSWQNYLGKAESLIKEQGAVRLGVNLDAASPTVVRTGQGKAPLLAKPKPEYVVSVVYICDAFFAVYQGAVFSLPELVVQLPAQGEEVYFRHVSAINYNPPNLEVILSNGKSMRKFDVGAEGGGAVLGALRAKLREPVTRSSLPAPQRSVERPEIQAAPSGPEATSPGAGEGKSSLTRGQDDERYCYVRLGKLKQLLGEPSVLDVLVEQLEVPGAPKNLKQLTAQEKMQCIETQIDHFRRTPTSVWYGVPTLEVLAASIWRAADDPFYREKGLLTKKLVRREWFCGVSEEDDLRVPVAKWLKNKGFEPYMEIPLGSGRVDVLGTAKPGFSSSGRYLAVELKNDYEQFKRALNQMSTFAEYTNAVYMACTPDFAAEYLDHNEKSTGHWDQEVLERKLTGGGFGLLIVERDQVFEVVKPIEKTPTEANSLRVAGALSSVNLIEC
jgi:hypothetical protein